MRSLTILLVITLWAFNSNAQYPHDLKYDYTWVMGYGSSADHVFGKSILSFNGTDFDTSYHSSDVWYYATSTAISDTAGHLKYTTNGIAIFDTAFNKIPGGDSINCCNQAFTVRYPYGYGITDGATFIKPNYQSDIYYLLHEFVHIEFGIAYSRTRITTFHEQSGGAVVLSKNVNIISDTLWPASNELCRHANGKDWWMVRKHWKKNRFYVFLIDDNGAQLKSVQEFSGYIPPFHTQSVFSPDGSKFVIGAVYNYVPDSVFVAKFDFDRCTGTLSNPQYHYWKLNEASLTGSGCAISPNSRFLYVSTLKIIFQFDLDAANWPATKTIVAEYDGYMDTINSNPWPTRFQWMQSGPDNKIYVTAGSTRYLHTIDNPDVAGAACNANQHSFRLPTVNQISMPNFPNYRLGPIDGSDCDTLGIDNIDNINEVLDNNKEPVKLYPNPATDYITLFVPRITKQWQFALYDIQGREVLHVHSRGAFRSINIAHLAQGMYLWKLVYEDGKQENGKVVKQ